MNERSFLLMYSLHHAAMYVIYLNTWTSMLSFYVMC
jgi:hypothetical protein